MKKERVAAYCRVSTNSDDQANSYRNQKEFFETELSKNPTYSFVGIYADKGLTGTSLRKRPEFNRLLADCGLDENYRVVKPSKIDRIFVKNTSRFARNVSVDIILKALVDNKVYVHFLDLNKSTESSEDITYIQIFLSFDERDSRDKSVKVLWGIEQSAKRNVIKTSSRIFGFDYIPMPENRLVQNKDSKVVKMIFEYYAKGMGIRRIINKLTEDGYVARSGKPFCKTQISHILTNEKYAGLNPILKYDNGKVFAKNSYAKVKDSYEIKKTDRIEAIISPDLFYECKKIMESKVNHKNQLGKNNGTSTYRGLLVCGKCESVYTSNSDRGRKFYNCKAKKTLGTRVCDNINVSEKTVTEFIAKLTETFNLFKTLYLDKLVISLLRKRRYELAEDLNTSSKEELEELRNKRDEIQKKADNFFDTFLSSESSVLGSSEMANNYITKMQREKDEIVNKIKELEHQDEYIVTGIYNIEKLIKEIQSSMGKKITEKDMLKMITKIEVNKYNGEVSLRETIYGLNIYKSQNKIAEYLGESSKIFSEQIDVLMFKTETEYKETIIDKYYNYKDISLEEKILKTKQAFNS